MKRLIFGCGYLGRRVARLWHAEGDEVHVVTRSARRADEFSATGWIPHVADVTRVATLDNLPMVETVLFAVGYDRSAGVPIEEVYDTGLANVLARLSLDTGRVIYISSTGVYGPAEGDWVDEQTPVDPQRAGGRACAGAEMTLAAHPLAGRSVIMRLAGIYGPGRVPYLDKLRAGKPLEVPSEGWLNLIHVDDAAAIVALVEAHYRQEPDAEGCEVFNVCDGHPVLRGDYYCEVARQLGTAEPTFILPSAETPAAARARANKRISNRRLAATFAPSFRYPSYREGLAMILAGD